MFLVYPGSIFNCLVIKSAIELMLRLHSTVPFLFPSFLIGISAVLSRLTINLPKFQELGITNCSLGGYAFKLIVYLKLFPQINS